MTDGAATATRITEGEARRLKRRRTLIILASISIGWKVLVFTIGIAIPHWIIDDGIAKLPAEKRAYAADAKAVAKGLWTNPIERWGFVRAVRVLRVDSTAAGATCSGHRARVKAYTYFAIPYSEAVIECDGGRVLYRVFKGRGAATL